MASLRECQVSYPVWSTRIPVGLGGGGEEDPGGPWLLTDDRFPLSASLLAFARLPKVPLLARAQGPRSAHFFGPAVPLWRAPQI